jgi:hypothetical protein
LAHCSAGFCSIFPPIFQRKPLLDGSRGIHGIHAQYMVLFFIFDRFPLFNNNNIFVIIVGIIFIIIVLSKYGFGT